MCCDSCGLAKMSRWRAQHVDGMEQFSHVFTCFHSRFYVLSLAPSCSDLLRSVLQSPGGGRCTLWRGTSAVSWPL